MIKKTYNIIGLMSGTSLDGLDICYVKFNKGPEWKYEILISETLAYDSEMKSDLKKAINFSSRDLDNLDKPLSHTFHFLSYLLYTK